MFGIDPEKVAQGLTNYITKEERRIVGLM